MVHETTIIGIIGFIIAIGIFLSSKTVLIPVIVVMISIAMITLGKKENEIEKRKDG